jgi:PilZ domain
MAQPPENRRHDRFRGTLTVQVVGPATHTFGTIYEVSEGGAFVEVSPLPPVGAHIRVDVLVDGVRNSLPAVVRYRLATETGPRGLEGVGVEWTELSPDERELVGRLVERAQAGKPLRG